MSVMTRLGSLLSATARERRKQVPVRVLLAILGSWAMASGGRPEWIAPWLMAVAAVQAFEIVALLPFRKDGPTPGPLRVVLALASTSAMAALFAATSVAIWAMDSQGLEGFAMLIIAGGLLTNVASGIESRSIFYVGATPYLVALVAMPVMAIAGSPSGHPVLTGLASLLFIGAIMNVYGRVQSARAAELAAAKDAALRLQQAESAMADRAAMAAIISHELRTPVSAIQAGAHVIRHAETPRQHADTADLIIDASALMTRMLNDLLDHSKMEAGAMTFETRGFDLSVLISDTTRFWQAQAADKGLMLIATGATKSEWLSGDPYRMRQVLNNLLSNAIKFTAQGTIAIEVETSDAPAEARLVKITVRDQGAGIPADAIPRLFSPFAQGSSEVARNYGGTGLGLKVSRDLSRLMGGDLVVVSEEGQGAAFTLSLVMGHASPDHSEATRPEARPADLPRLRVLAVDDHEINRRTLALVLQPLDVDLSTASDGTLALDLLSRQAFDVVLMDVNMPGIDGNETTRRLRASSGPNAGVPVIGFSAGTEAEQIAACRASGMSDWLAKPLEPAKLYDALRRATVPGTVAQAEAA